MKSKIRKNGSISMVSIVGLLLLLSLEQVMITASAARIGNSHKSTMLNHNQESERIRSHQKNTNRGIIDLAVAKIEKEDMQQAKQMEAINLKSQQNYLKASRQALLLTGTYNNVEDTAQILKNMRMSPTSGQSPSVSDTKSYNDQINKIAEQQPEYKDEYEGFGSLTEMIKNTGKIADKAAEVVIEQEKAQKDAQDKAEQIKTAKSKMKLALDNSLKPKRIEAPKAPVAPPAPQNTTISQQVSIGSNESQPNGENGKLSDQEQSQIIEQVVVEQQTPNNGPQSDEEGAGANEQFRGFIGKFTDKFKDPTDKIKAEDNANVQTDESETPKPKKGMFARFQEKIQQDQADSDKAQEVVQEYQHGMELTKKSVLDRETERLVQEQDDEYALEAESDGTSTSGEV